MKAGIINNTARVFNLTAKGTIKGQKFMIRIPLVPGFNVVDKEKWQAFVNGNKVHPYVKKLKDAGDIKWGKELDARAEKTIGMTKEQLREATTNADIQPKTSSVPKGSAEKEAKAKAEAEAKMKAEAEAKVKAEADAKVKADAEADGGKENKESF